MRRDKDEEDDDEEEEEEEENREDATEKHELRKPCFWCHVPAKLNSEAHKTSSRLQARVIIA